MQNLSLEIDVMSELRQRTHPAHVALEELMPLFRPEFSLEGYLSLLEKFLGILEPLECPVRTHLRQLRDERPSVDRIELLREDLFALGRTPFAVASLPRCESLPEISSTEQALGAFYVLEGSMLGGQAISRELRSRFSLTPDHGASFFASRGVDVKTRWAQDRELLRSHLASPAALNTAVSSANATFLAFHAWFKRSS